jgi:probable HAF family extracellular repeat protein
VGTYSDANNHNHGFLYSGGVYTTLDDPLAAGTGAFGINDSGQVVGTYVDGKGIQHGFLYSGGTYAKSASADQHDGRHGFV